MQASKLLTITYPREYGYERTCPSQVSQQRERVVLRCILLVCTWIDNELIVSMDAVMRGELVVHHAALMQNACHRESNLIAGGNLLTFWQFSSSDVCPWNRPLTSLEIHLRDSCSVWAHTDCLNKSGGGNVVACRCVCDTVCLPKNCLLTEKFGRGL